MEERSACVPGATRALFLKLASGNWLFRAGDRSRVQLQLVGVDQTVHAGVQEYGQRDRAENRNAIFEITPCGHIAARENQLVGGNGLRDVGQAHRTRGRIHESLLPRRTIVVKNVYLCRGGHVRHRADAPDFESADVLLSSHVEAVERRGDPAVVAGEELGREMHSDHVLGRQPAPEVARHRTRAGSG